MKPDDLRALRDVLGEEGVEEHAPLEIEGIASKVTLSPPNEDALASTLAVLCERGRAILVRGGGTRLAIGNPITRADAVLTTQRLAGIDLLDAEEGVVLARAGTPLGVLQDAAQESGWELPLDPPGTTTTLGGALAAASLGPRALGFGRARDVLLGLGVVLGSGERTRCGGRVVKNVTGYDLAKLYVGSFGTLGVIDSAWLRLRPQPERVELFTADADAPHGALAVARAAGTRAAVWIDAALARELADAPGPLLLVELAGSEPVVEERSRSLRDELGATPAEARLLDDVRDFQEAPPPALRVRVDTLPGRVAAASAPLLAAGARLAVHAGLGVLYAGWREPCDEALAAARAAAQAGGGGWRLESSPLDLRREHEAFGETPASLPLMKSLKAAYDPGAVLNPGRFLGGF